MEEAQRQKKEVTRREGGRERVKSRESQDYMGRLSRYAPHRVVRDRAVHVCEVGAEAQTPAHREKSLKYCAFHQEDTHDTNECRTLQQRQQQPYIRDGNLVQKRPRGPPWIQGSQTLVLSRTGSISREGGKQEAGPRKEDRKSGEGPAKGVINMISGGSTDGDLNRARKSLSRRESLGVEEGRQGSGPVITFGPQDLEGVNLPHNDALLIQARIANYDVRRVFIDSGSSVNIIFQEAFEQMDLQGYELSPVKTALYGFSGTPYSLKGKCYYP
ncbi:uncharacterized protein [Henckelia pumila]|uniref:uncharacterized protein n=1 Tax=Henckelia pumila TaxID=405737 RepID=UPI003C6DE373